MTPLRAQMIRELELHRKPANTIKAYVTAVAQLAGYYHRSPEQISVEEIRSFIHRMITHRQWAYSTCNQKLAGIRFFYQQVLDQPRFELRIPTKRSGRLPEPLSREEIRRLIDAARNRKHRVLMMTTYGTGVRVSELVRLKAENVHAERMAVRINQGKGHKDRYTLLSPRLLQELREYWREYRPAGWLFVNRDGSSAMPEGTAQGVIDTLKSRAGIKHGHGIHSLRHSFGTHLMEAGVALPVIQRRMGHASLSATAKYPHVTTQHVQSLQSPLELLRLPQPQDLER